MKAEYKEINIEGTVERLHTTEEMVKKLIKMSLESDMLEQAEKAFANGTLEEAQRAIHTIKGTAANTGLDGLSKLALEIETKIKENEFLDLELLDVMKTVWAELKTQIDWI